MSLLEAARAASLDEAAAATLIDAMAVSVEVVDSRWRDGPEAAPLLRLQSHYFALATLALASLLERDGLLAAPFASRADEGMWLPDMIGKLPLSQMKKRGFELKPEEIWNTNAPSWKDAIVQISIGGTGSFVSPDGLILTNHPLDQINGLCFYGKMYRLIGQSLRLAASVTQYRVALDAHRFCLLQHLQDIGGVAAAGKCDQHIARTCLHRQLVRIDRVITLIVRKTGDQGRVSRQSGYPQPRPKCLGNAVQKVVCQVNRVARATAITADKDLSTRTPAIQQFFGKTGNGTPVGLL
mgnify:CR=1 FL=1